MGNNLEPIGSDERIRIVQSNLITTARYEFSVIEKRILYCIINQINIGSKNNPEDYKDDSGWRNITLCINGSDLAKCGEKTAEIRSAKIMEVAEMQEVLSEIARMQRLEDVVVVEGVDKGVSEARIIQKKNSANDAIKAITQLAKMQGVAENINVNVSVPVFGGEENLED